MSKSTINILMTGGGAPGAAGIINCLQAEKSFNITVADANPEAIGKYLAGDFVTIPFATDAKFAEEILEICSKKRIDIILPLVTRELIPLSKNKEAFAKKGAKLLCSPYSSLEIANNKGRLYQFLQWRGIAVPEFRIAENIKQFKNAVQELGYPQSMVCFKPSESNGSRGFRILSEEINELDLLFNQKPNTTFLDLNNTIRILGSGAFPELLISEFLPGEEYSVDCLAKAGESVLIIPRLRKKMQNGISIEGEIIEEKSIIAYCESIIKELNLHGNIGIQVKKSMTGEYLILEINPRVQGTISAIIGAGVNLPVLAVKQEIGLPIDDKELQVKWGTKFSRYWTEVFQ
jgi:carbamoyl-phosphate synthase large subunit